MNGTARKGDLLRKGNLVGKLEYGKIDNLESNYLGVVSVSVDGEKISYLATIKDKLILGWEHAND